VGETSPEGPGDGRSLAPEGSTKLTYVLYKSQRDFIEINDLPSPFHHAQNHFLIWSIRKRASSRGFRLKKPPFRIVKSR
jgi:hypothetical protein